MKYYRATEYSWEEPIKEINVERESETSIWINNKRIAKSTHGYKYFLSYEDAKNWLISISSKRIEMLWKGLNISSKRIEMLWKRLKDEIDLKKKRELL